MTLFFLSKMRMCIKQTKKSYNLLLISRSRKEFDPLRYGSNKPQKLYKGVYEKIGKGNWYAQCSHGGDNAYIGTYDTELEAALAYDKRGRELKCPEERLCFPTFLSE